jgi:sec-independent protein translocase protein TatC
LPDGGSGHGETPRCGVNQLVLNGPLDSFYLRVKVAVIAGVVVSSPVWLGQIWAFVAPGLYAREKRWSYFFLGTAVPLFPAGVTLTLLAPGECPPYDPDAT